MAQQRAPRAIAKPGPLAGPLLLLIALSLSCEGRSTPGGAAGTGSGGRASLGGGTTGGVEEIAGGGSGARAGGSVAGRGFGGSAAASSAGAGGLGGAGDQGGAESAGAAAGDQNSGCDPAGLWIAITDQAVRGLGQCFGASATLGPDEHLSRLRGAVVVDDDGRVVDNTGLSEPEKKHWLKQLGDERWVCLARQTIGYKCNVAR